MQILIRGEMTIADIRQALYEKLHELEDDYAIHHARGATLYVNPTDEFGEPVVARGPDGRIVAKMHCRGPYKSAADELKP
jgi:hypothetical protein